MRLWLNTKNENTRSVHYYDSRKQFGHTSHQLVAYLRIQDSKANCPGITTTRLRTFRLRHFVYRHFVYRYFVYYDFPCWNRSWSDEMNTISIEPGLMQGILPN